MHSRLHQSSMNASTSTMSQTSPSKRGVFTYACIDFESLFEDSMTNSSLYQVNLSSIKKCQEIRSGKELEKEAIRIAESLQDTIKNWQVRLAAIRLVQSVIVTPHLNSVKEIVGFVQRVSRPLAIQLQDKRSALTREACQAILVLAHVFEDDFGPIAADTFVNDQALFKLMQVTNGVMAEQAHTCLLGILAKTKSNKIIDTIFKQTSDQRKQIRVNCAEYLLFILLRYPAASHGNFMDRYRKDFQVYLTKAMQDSNSEVRRRARMVFMRFLQLEPQLGHELIFRDVDCSYQRALYDDYVKHGIDPGITKLFRSDDEDDQDDEYGDEDESDLVTEENFSNNYPSQIHSIENHERNSAHFVSAILNESPQSNTLAIGESTLANSLVLVSSTGEDIQAQQVAKNGPSMFQKRQMAVQRKRSLQGRGAEANVQQRSEKQAMTAKSKASATGAAQHNFGQVTFERPSTSAEAGEMDEQPTLLLQPVKSAKTFKNAQRYKSPQLSSSTLALPAMQKNSKEGQPRSTLLKSARQSMMDFNKIKLQQQEAPDEEMGSNQSPEVSWHQQQRESARQKVLTMNRMAAGAGGQPQKGNLQGSPVRLKNNFVGSPTTRYVQTANHSERQHRRSIGSVNNSSRTEQAQDSSKSQLDKLKRTYNLVSTIGRRSPIFRGSPPQTSPPGVLARTGSGGTVSRTPNTAAQTTATKNAETSGSTTTKRVKFDARKYITQKKATSGTGTGSSEREEETQQKKQNLKVQPQVSHPPTLPKDIYCSRESEIKNNKSQSSLSQAAQQYMNPHASSTGRRSKQQRNKVLTAYGDGVSSNSMIHSSTHIMSPNREAGADASSQNDHPQNEMLTLDLEDTVSLDHKQCQVVLEMPEKYESSCKKPPSHETQLPKDADDSIIHLNEIDDQISPIGLGEPPKPKQKQTGDEPSSKSPLVLDLANDVDDTDLADDLTVEGELQQPPPKSILQEDTKSIEMKTEIKSTRELPRLPTDADNLDLKKDVDGDSKRYMSQNDVVDAIDLQAVGPKTERLEHNVGQECVKGFETERNARTKKDRGPGAPLSTKNTGQSNAKEQGFFKQMDNIDITSSKIDRIEQNGNMPVLLETTQSQLILDQSLSSSKLGLTLEQSTPKEGKPIGFETVQHQVKLFSEVYGPLIEKVEEIDVGESNWIEELHSTFDMIQQEAGPQISSKFKYTDNLADQMTVHCIASTHFKLLKLIDQQKTMDNIYQCLSLAGLTLSSLSQLAARNGTLQRIVESKIDKALLPLLSVLTFNNLDLNPYQSTLIPYLPVFSQLYTLCTPGSDQLPNLFKLTLLAQAERYSQQAVHGTDCLKRMSVALRILQEVEPQASAERRSDLNVFLNRLCQTMVELPVDGSLLTIEELLQKTSQKILQTSKPLIVNHMPSKSLEKISEMNESQDMSCFSKTRSVLYETARTSVVTQERNIREDATGPQQTKQRMSQIQVEEVNKSEARASLAPVSFRLSNTMSKIDFEKDGSEAEEEDGDMKLNQTIKSEPGTAKMETAGHQSKQNPGQEPTKEEAATESQQLFPPKQPDYKDEESINSSSNLNSSRVLSLGAQQELPMDIHTGAMTSNLPVRKQDSLGPFGHIGGDGSSSHGGGSHKVENGAARSLVDQIISTGRDHETLNFELSYSVQSDQRNLEATRMSDIRLAKLDSGISKVLDQEPIQPNVSSIMTNQNESSSQEMLDFTSQLRQQKPQSSSLNLNLLNIVGKGLPPNFSISPNSSSFQNMSECITDRSNNLLTQGLLQQMNSASLNPKPLSIPSLAKYQQQIQGDSQNVDYYDLISGMFLELRQKLQEAAQGDGQGGKLYLVEFQVLLREILKSQAEIIYEEHLSPLFDEIAETIKLLEDNETAKKMLEQIQSDAPNFFNLTPSWHEQQTTEKLTKIFKCLNLKMLNKQHPFLREVLKILRFYLERLEAGDSKNLPLFQIINDNLAALAQAEHEQIGADVKKEVIECVRTIQIIGSKS